MTNFEYYAQSADELTRLLSAATDDALRAKGCSVKLSFPPDDGGNWGDWLEAEYDGEFPAPPLFPDPPKSETANEYNIRIVTDALEAILDGIARIDTPFAQAVRDIITEAQEEVREL